MPNQITETRASLIKIIKSNFPDAQFTVLEFKEFENGAVEFNPEPRVLIRAEFKKTEYWSEITVYKINPGKEQESLASGKRIFKGDIPCNASKDEPDFDFIGKIIANYKLFI
jgi:hypothetical protein